MSQYLEEAAAVLRDAVDANDRQPVPTHARRVEIAQQFATLAAIDKGLLPADMVRGALDTITRQHN